MVRRSPTAPPDNIYEVVLQVFPDQLLHFFRCLVVFPESIGQACIGVGRNIEIGMLSEPFQVRFELIGPEGTIKSYA